MIVLPQLGKIEIKTTEGDLKTYTDYPALQVHNQYTNANANANANANPNASASCVLMTCFSSLSRLTT